MTNSKALFRDLISALTLAEPHDELQDISYRILEKLFGLSKTDILAEKIIPAGADQLKLLEEYVTRLNNHEPVQYIVGEADFYGRKFMVNQAVLIPRPETEELVHLIIQHIKVMKKTPVRMLDIGTGSGCIPITLALELPCSTVFGTDVSTAALQVAQQNAMLLNAPVNFLNHDILKEEIREVSLDVIVSNPPYITPAEKHAMKENVLLYEPHLALFVTENDPLLFYRVIASKAKQALVPGGLIAFEINEQFSRETASLLEQHGFLNAEVVQDISGKNRMVKAFT